MDRDNANFIVALATLREAFPGNIVAAQLPIGEGSDFRGVVDLISMKAYLGDSAVPVDVPPDMVDAAETARTQLIEAAAEGDDDLIMKYLDGGDLTAEEISRGMRAGIAASNIIPVFCGSAVNNIGVLPLMNAMVAAMPNPAEFPPIAAQKPDGSELSLPISANGPLAVFVWKTVADPFVGKISYFRVQSGKFHGDTRVYSMPGATEERIAQIFVPRGKEQLGVQQLVAGDFGGVTKLANTGTNDTLCEKSAQIILPSISYPEPLFSLAVSPKTKGDSAKMGPALARAVEEIPRSAFALNRAPMKRSFRAWVRCIWTLRSAGWRASSALR